MRRFFTRLFFVHFILIVSFFAALGFIFNPAFKFPFPLVSAVISFSLFLALLQSFLVTRSVFAPLEGMKKELDKLNDKLMNKVQHLAREREEMLAVLTSMVEGVLVINPEEKVVLANAACARMFGWKSGEWNNRPFWEILRHRELLDLFKRALGQGVFEAAELSIFMPEEKIVHAQASPVRTGSGKKPGLVCVLHDITHLKKLEGLHTEFVANVSHELKTPLTSIKGFVETLLGGALDNPETARHFLTIIDGHAARLEKLISELLELARFDSGEIPQQFKPVDVSQLIQRSRQFLENEILEKKHQFDVQCPGTLPPVAGDEENLERALSNLIQNAVKFTPSGGKIAVTALEGKNEVHIAVSDNGIGISEDHLPRIFERFYRADKARSRKEGGTGLGLSIVKHIAEAHGGKVSVESRSGKGSTFTLSIPKYAS